LSTISWAIDRRELVVDIAGDWLSFAQSNDAKSLLPEVVIGNSLWSYISGVEVQDMYRQIIVRVRETADPVDFCYRCDAPDRRRLMRMEIERADDGLVWFHSRLIQEIKRPWFNSIYRHAVRNKCQLDICSVCRRVGVDDMLWSEPEDAANSIPKLCSNQTPMLVERICDDCINMHRQGARYLITDYNSDSSNRPVPLFVFLHGGGRQSYCLRKHTPPRLSKLFDDQAFLMLSPIDLSQNKWQSIDLDHILGQVMAHYSIDPTQIHLSGVSAGASRAWQWAASSKSQFASLSTFGGMLHKLYGYPSVRTFAAHGQQDEIIPFDWVEPILRALKSKRSDNRVTVFEDAGHDVWSRIFADPSYWKWVFGQPQQTSESLVLPSFNRTPQQQFEAVDSARSCNDLEGQLR